MPVIWLKLPNQQVQSNGRPRECPYCAGSILQRWGRVTKPVRDADEAEAEIYRYRCAECERTFRHYPQGLDRSDQSRRIRQIAGLVWAMGMSTREVVGTFKDLGILVSRSTVWREGKQLAGLMDGQDGSKALKKYAVDRTYIHRVSTKLGVVVALTVEGGKSSVLGTLDEYNPRVVKSWLESLIQDIDVQVSVLGTGTLDGYPQSLYREQLALNV